MSEPRSRLPLRTFIYPPGTRVRIRRGAAPLDARTEGRTGLVVRVDEYRPYRYGVVLSGESAETVFTEDELEAIESGARPGDAGEAGPGTAP
jgi:hypothetical protein